MPYKNPIGRYRPTKRHRRERKALAFRSKFPGTLRQCGQGIPNGDQRYCPACGKAWPKDEEHP